MNTGTRSGKGSLTRDQFLSAGEYDALVARAYRLGIRGTITPTAQYPSTEPEPTDPG
jgi:hypothetical protein